VLQDECHYGDDTVARSQIRRSINGYMYDNVPGMEMRIGERVRWYLAGIQLSEKASCHHSAADLVSSLDAGALWFPSFLVSLFGFPASRGLRRPVALCRYGQRGGPAHGALARPDSLAHGEDDEAGWSYE
jgi:hypothetical protein